MTLKSWSCKGCTNICYRTVDGETFRYCRQVIETGENRTEWRCDYIACLDYTTDPASEDKTVRLHDCMMERR